MDFHPPKLYGKIIRKFEPIPILPNHYIQDIPLPSANTILVHASYIYIYYIILYYNITWEYHQFYGFLDDIWVINYKPFTNWDVLP